MSGGSVVFEGVTLSFGEGARRIEAVRNLDLSIAAGELICILGPSGCGKSTLLKSIAGYLAPERGRVLVDGEPVTAPGPDRGVVSQQHTLFPWRTALDNVSFGPKMRGVSPEARKEAAQKLLGEMGLSGFEKAYPQELSGGMQQRVEIARALVNEPKVLLLDEPFSALDAATRRAMQELLLSLWKARRITIVFVTHDIDEAILLGRRIVVLGPRPAEVRQEFSRPFSLGGLGARVRAQKPQAGHGIADRIAQALGGDGLLQHGHVEPLEGLVGAAGEEDEAESPGGVEGAQGAIKLDAALPAEDVGHDDVGRQLRLRDA